MYQVSNLGNVRRLTTKAGNLKPHPLKQTKVNSCMRVFLCKENHAIGYMVDKLVALYFVPNLENKEFVFHKDRNINNNISTNLIWVSENEALMLCRETDTASEKWKDVNGFENLYEISSLGRVKSLPRVITNHNGSRFLLPSIFLKQSLHYGYPQVRMCKNGKKNVQFFCS